MLPELLEQDHRQQAGTGPAAGQDMEWRRRLADLLAVAAGELLADVQAKHQVLCAASREPIDYTARDTPPRLVLFAMDTQKPDHGARLSRNPRNNFFLNVNYLTLLGQFLNDAA